MPTKRSRSLAVPQFCAAPLGNTCAAHVPERSWIAIAAVTQEGRVWEKSSTVGPRKGYGLKSEPLKA